jgi:hypothetical protein
MGLNATLKQKERVF